MYLVSPQLFVTSEHIISESASTSSSLAFSLSLVLSLSCSLSFVESGEATELLGVLDRPIRGLGRCDSEEGRARVPVLVEPAGDFEGVPGSLRLWLCSASLFSNVPRSVFPHSSSFTSPDRLRRASILPRRFSKPSMYFALFQHQCQQSAQLEPPELIPFGLSALLLYLREYALCFIIDAMRTRRHLSITFDLLFPAHVASLPEAH